MDEEIKKKNLLDLHFHKYLVIASTSVLIAFTYIIGIAIAFFTKQIKLDNLTNTIVFINISLFVLCICSIVFINSLYHLQNIPKVVKRL
jgi:hypothetical protein